MTEVEFTIEGEQVFVTENTRWTLRSDAYLRLPRTDRVPDRGLGDGALDDYRWIPYKKVWKCGDDQGEWLRILPSNRADHMQGVTTGYLVDG